MNRTIKKTVLFALLCLFISSQALQAGSWFSLPKFNFPTQSFTQFCSNHAEKIAVGVVAVGLAAYGVYHYLFAKKPSRPAADQSQDSESILTLNNSDLFGHNPEEATCVDPKTQNQLNKSLKPYTSKPSSGHRYPDQEEIIPGVIAYSQIVRASSDNPQIAAQAAATVPQDTTSSSSASSSARPTTPSSPVAGDVASVDSTDSSVSPQSVSSIADLSDYYDRAVTQFGLFKYQYEGYSIFEDKNFFTGQRNKFTVKDDLKNEWRSRPDFSKRAELVQNYKIHLMPKNNDMLSVVNLLLLEAKKDPAFKQAINALKCMEKINPSDLTKPEIMPRIVIYPASSKEAAQYVLNKVCEIFEDTEGLDVTPRYNKKITSLIYYAQGDGQHKTGSYEEYFEADKVHYKADFTDERHDYALEIPACVSK